VNDLTCSMGPYAAQIIIWHKLNNKKRNPELFLFFNDGNGMPNDQKKIGKTGGFHYGKAKDEKELAKLMLETMATGCSGDSLENDVEAALFMIEKCKTCEDIVLIADNYSSMRDFGLIKKLKKPVHVILCGARGGVHVQYLQLARETGGSIHTIEEDVENLAKLSEGETISIGSQKYIIKKGKFTPVQSL